MLFSNGALRADDVLTHGTNFDRVRIVGLTGGKLDLRLPDGRMQSVALDEVDLIQVDRGAAFSDFNQAERLRAEGKAQQSIARYRRSMRLTEGFWSEVVPARFLFAADQAGNIETAVNLLVRVTRGSQTGPTVAVRLMPKNIPDKRNGAMAAALETLSAALNSDLDQAQRAVLTVARFKMIQHIETPDEREAMRVAELTMPAPLQTEAVFSAVYDAVALLAEKRSLEIDLLSCVDRAIRDCPEGLLPGFLLLRGEALTQIATSKDDWLRAARPFLRVAIHFPDDPNAAAGYYGAAVALERSGRSKEALSLLKRCLDCDPADRRTIQSARAMLERLIGSQNNAKP